jgi:hypothetical protein
LGVTGVVKKKRRKENKKKENKRWKGPTRWDSGAGVVRN